MIETVVYNKNELLAVVQLAMPGDIIRVKGTTFSLIVGDKIHDKYLTSNGSESKRYKTNLEKLFATIKRTPEKLWGF